jgi:UDP-3-O-[3-hydroxymyristoyl] glucosamine N-acyltransferase
MTHRTASELAELCGAVLEGDGARLIVGPASLGQARADQISFLRSVRHARALESTAAGAVLVPLELEPARRDLALLRCEDPSRAFTRVVEAFRPATPPLAPGIHPTAVVAEDAELGNGVHVGAGCVIGPAAVLAPGVRLHPGVIIGARCRIGARTELRPNVVLYEDVEIGSDGLVHAGTVIGSDGFGFEPGAAGWEKIPQFGGVVIGDRVEIGANCAIDRGRFEATRIGHGVKLDNLVHVAHNVVVEDDVLLIAQVGIAGSARVCKGAILAGQVGVAGHLTIGAGARIGAQSGVGRDIEPGAEHFGSPSREKGEALRLHMLAGKLPDLIRRVRDLERRVGGSTGTQEPS